MRFAIQHMFTSALTLALAGAALPALADQANGDGVIKLQQGFSGVCENCDMRDRDLSFAGLSGAQFPGGKFQRANMEQVIASASVFDNADFSGAVLREAMFTSSRLNGARFAGSSMQDFQAAGAKFIGADLSGAKMTHATLVGADLTNATLLNAHLDDANLTGAVLSNANAVAASMQDADLSGAMLNDVNFSGADFSGATGLDSAHFGGACGDAQTRLPQGFEITNCAAEGMGGPEELIHADLDGGQHDFGE